MLPLQSAALCLCVAGGGRATVEGGCYLQSCVTTVAVASSQLSLRDSDLHVTGQEHVIQTVQGTLKPPRCLEVSGSVVRAEGCRLRNEGVGQLVVVVESLDGKETLVSLVRDGFAWDMGLFVHVPLSTSLSQHLAWVMAARASHLMLLS